MMKRYTYILLLLLMALTACNPGKNDRYVDFEVGGVDTTMFRVYARHDVSLGETLPANCYLPNGVPVNTYDEVADTIGQAAAAPMRASSVTMTAMVQSLMDIGHRNRVIELSGIYQSVGINGEPLTLSGKVVLPADGKFKRYIVVSHYTIGSNAEAPSVAFPFESVLVPLGYALIVPDYIGYGVTEKMVHPYLCMEITARNVLDMYNAVEKYMKANNVTPEFPDIFLMGYSQGGANTMALLHYIETSINVPEEKLPVRRVFAGGGPYDVKATYEKFVDTNVTDYPVAVPLVLQGMILGNKLDLKLESMIRPRVLNSLNDWVNSKRYTTAQVNAFINTHVTSDMLTEKAMNKEGADVAELYKAMVQNSIVAYDWDPQTPIYMFHSMDDETVTFQNALNAKARWDEANIQYNFGHYGGHVKGCLRFIYSVKSLLKEEEQL